MDYLLFTVGMLFVFGLLHRFSWRGRQSNAVSLAVWLVVIATLSAGWYLVGSAGKREFRRMRQMVEGLAPTYAQEIALLGHEEITPETSPDSPRYWRMISAEKRWLAANPSIRDIYTLRKLANGQVALIVDSETDYDHNGRFEGEREQRTPIGKIYPGPLADKVDAVLAGQPFFSQVPSADRWDSWVTSLVPIRNFKGDGEAVLGVDFDAKPLVAAVEIAQRTTLAWLTAFLLALGVGTALPRRRAATSGQPVAQATAPEGPAPAPASGPDATGPETLTLETLINSIDGIVWEADALTLDFTYVSPQCESILGYSPEHWKTTQAFWKSSLHPEDQWAFDHRQRLISNKVPYACEYRMIASDGHTVWIRESAAVVLDSSDAPKLVRGVYYDITAQKRAAEELEEAHKKLVDSSRHAGMAEVATGVLHNVGNVLNSVNISGSVISERLRTSKVIELGKVAGLLTLHKANFAGFVASDPRGPHVPELISLVTDALRAEHTELLEEVDAITRNISHIKEIVSMQQGFAKGAGIVEALCITAVVDDAIKINAIHLSKHRVNVVQAYEDVPKVLADKHLVLQILVNLLRNAQQAIESYDGVERRIVVKIQSSSPAFVRISVQDSGGGIAAENLTRIFSHGFTTKKSGHGFGLHSSALAAKGMDGALSVHSEGLGTGATFLLELPVEQPALAAAAA